MRKVILGLIIAATTLVPAHAGYVCNAHGAVVTEEHGLVFYLGKNCDAAIKGGGSGHWFNSASFLAVFIDGKGYMVTQEIDCLPFCTPPD